MNKVNHLRSSTCFLLIFFLFGSVGFRLLNQGVGDIDYKHFSISGHSGIATVESQLPFEEKGQDYSLYNVDSINLGFELFVLSSVKEDLFCKAFCDDHSKLPIYLAKRTLLI